MLVCSASLEQEHTQNRPQLTRAEGGGGWGSEGDVLELCRHTKDTARIVPSWPWHLLPKARGRRHKRTKTMDPGPFTNRTTTGGAMDLRDSEGTDLQYIGHS